MERNLGRIQACHSQVADLYEMKMRKTGKAHAYYGDRNQNNSNGSRPAKEPIYYVPI